VIGLGGNQTTAGTPIWVVNSVAVAVPSLISTVSFKVNGFTSGATNQVKILVFQQTSSGHYQILATSPATIAATGNVTLNAGSDFPAITAAAGQYVGFTAGAGVDIILGDSTVSTLTLSTLTNPGTATAAYATGQPEGALFALVAFTPVATQAAVVAAQTTANAALAATSAGGWSGKNLGVWGHSLTTPGFEYTGVTVGGTTYTYWQQALAATLGMTWTFNNGVPGAGYYNAFSNYGTSQIGGNFTNGSNVISGIFANGGGPLTTLAVGEPVSAPGSGLAGGTTITAVNLGASTITVSSNANVTTSDYSIICGTPVSIATVGSTLSSGTTSGGVNGGAMTSGTTLVADLANVDILLVWYGDNDYGIKSVGSPGDALAANTNYGDLDNFLSIVFTAKPAIRVMLMDHGYAGRTFGIAGYQAIRTWLQTGGQYYGVGVMDMLTLSGLNPLSWATWQNSDSGQYLHPTNAGWAHYVPIMARNLNAY
jgi:hypothetical protein